jgi:hypothetical protein
MSLKTFFKKTNKNGPVSILSNLKERSHILTLTERFLHVVEEVKYKTVSLSSIKTVSSCCITSIYTRATHGAQQEEQ